MWQFKDLDMFTAWFKRLRARLEDYLQVCGLSLRVGLFLDYLLSRLSHHRRQFFMEPPSDKLLPDKNTIPGLPPAGPTLVISLDDTLTYSTWDVSAGTSRIGPSVAITRFHVWFSDLFASAT